MLSSIGGKKPKSKFLRDLLKNFQSPSASRSNAEEHGNADESAGSSMRSANQTSLKDGLGIAGRFVQTLVKKLPDCVDSNPVKMALSIVKTIMDIMNEINDKKDGLAECLQETSSLLGEVTRRMLAVPNSEAVNQEVEKYKKKIEAETTNICELTMKFNSNAIQNLDYENYKKKLRDISQRINDATRLFMIVQVDMQIIIGIKANQIYDDQKKASLKDLNPSKKADHKTVLAGQSLKREVCTEGTRVKILEDITGWANDRAANSPHVFWLTGQAGSGKTTIAYTIAKRFEKGQPTVLGGNFLCSRQFEETRSVNRILPTISYQLAHRCGPYETALHAHFTDRSAVVDNDVSEQVEELLVRPWCSVRWPNDPPTFLVVIDALDEISDNAGSTFLGVLLTTISQQYLIGLKFLVTSRTNPQIVDLCNNFSSKVICLLQDVPLEGVESDIKTYLEVKLPNLIGNLELGELNRRASGLFIYAAIAVRILTKPASITKKEQIRRLGHLVSKPSGLSFADKERNPLDELYEQIMFDAFSGFPEDDLTPRLRILHSYLCAAERISPSVAAILMDDDDEVARAVLDNLHAVLYVQDNRVFWYHASFPDFIFAQTRSNFRVGDEYFRLWCDEAAQHKLLATSCFRVMNSETYGLRFNIGDIDTSYLFDREHLDELSEKVDKNITPALRYSALHWAGHLLWCQAPHDFGNLYPIIADFLQIRVLFWIEAMNLLGLSNQCTAMLHVARYWAMKMQRGNNDDLLSARDLLEAAYFATYFAGSAAAESTPHLYISSLATWKQESRLSHNWKKEFSRVPAFTRGNAGKDVPLMTVRVPGTPSICSVAFSKDGTRLISGASDGFVRIWDASAGKEVKILNGHRFQVNSVEFSVDGRRVVSGSVDNSVRVWDVSTGRILTVMEGHSNTVKSVAFSKDGMRVVSGSYDKSVRIWDTATGDMLKVLKGHTGWVTSVAFTDDGACIVSGSDDRSVRLWDASTGGVLKVMVGHTDCVNSVAYSSHEGWIVSGSNDCSVRIWDTSTGHELRVMKGHINWVNSVAFWGNGPCIGSGSDDCSVRVWDASTGKRLKVLNGHDNLVHSVAFSSNGPLVMSGTEDGYVRVWDFSINPKANEPKIHTNVVNLVAFSGDGTQILSLFEDGSVRVWETSTGRVMTVLKDGTQSITSVAFSRNGTYIVRGSKDGRLRIWDVLGDAEVKVLKGHTNAVRSISFSSDDTLIVSGSDDKTVRSWGTSTGVGLKVMNGHTGDVNSVAFSKDSKYVASGSDDKSVRVWNLSTGNNLKVLEGHDDWVSSVSFSTDASLIVSGSGDALVRIWDAMTGIPLMILRGHTDWVRSVAFSSDDRHIMSSSYDHSVRVWDVGKGAEIQILKGGHLDDVRSVASSSNGRYFVSGSCDGSVFVWSLEDPIWHIAETNWISSATNDRLMWVPPEAQVLRRSNCHVVTGNHYSSVNFERSMIGSDWRKCYTPTSEGLGPG